MKPPRKQRCALSEPLGIAVGRLEKGVIDHPSDLTAEQRGNNIDAQPTGTGCLERHSTPAGQAGKESGTKIACGIETTHGQGAQEGDE